MTCRWPSKAAETCSHRLRNKLGNQTAVFWRSFPIPTFAYNTSGTTHLTSINGNIHIYVTTKTYETSRRAMHLRYTGSSKMGKPSLLGGACVWLPSLHCAVACCSWGLVVSVRWHMKQWPWDATDTLSWSGDATRTFPLCDSSVLVGNSLTQLDSIVSLRQYSGYCCWLSMCIVVIFHVHCCNCVYCCNPRCNCIMCVGHVTLDYISNRIAV